MNDDYDALVFNEHGRAGIGRYQWERWVKRIGMPQTVKLVAMILATYADGRGEGVRPSVIRVALEAGVSDRTINRAMRTLHGHGLIELVRQGARRHGGEPNEYRLTIPDDVLDRCQLDPDGRRIGGGDV
ncbi:MULTISPECIES: helix-turn-helix domain-containing protein [Gordonia]|uniref:helix-turn-helix domain-containing protein n=1 Tax=Gordonia TaxID=2053 RepID=UPI00339AF7CC